MTTIPQSDMVLLNGEEWRSVKGLEGYYEISSTGKVKSLERYSIRKNGVPIYVKETFIKQFINKRGYPTVTIGKESVRKTWKVHQLVAQAFIPNPDNKPQVNHINGIKIDNSIENLEWCTGEENIIHAIESGIYGNRRKNSKSKKILQYDFDGNLIGEYDSITEAYKATGVYRDSIAACVRGFKYHQQRKKIYPVNHGGGYVWKEN